MLARCALYPAFDATIIVIVVVIIVTVVVVPVFKHFVEAFFDSSREREVFVAKNIFPDAEREKLLEERRAVVVVIVVAVSITVAIVVIVVIIIPSPIG
jgi:hypothetical protein